MDVHNTDPPNRSVPLGRAPPSHHCLATVTDPGYLHGTAVMFSSFLRHNPWFEGDLVVLHDGLRERDRRRLGHLPGIRFSRVGEKLRHRLRKLAGKHPGLRRRLARFYSLAAFGLSGYECVLYLDSDILCTGDVRGLLDHPRPGRPPEEASHTAASRSRRSSPPGPPLVACPDQTRFRSQVRDAETFIPVERRAADGSREVLADVFNTGVMLIRPELLEPGITDRLLTYLHPDRWPGVRTGHTDQAVLNHHFGDRCGSAPERYNYLLAPDSDQWQREPMSHAVLLHFLGKPKPWHVLRTIPPDGAGDQRSRGWRLWEAEARRDALRRLYGARDFGPAARLAAAGGRRLAVRGWRALTRRRRG